MTETDAACAAQVHLALQVGMGIVWLHSTTTALHRGIVIEVM
jgi:hypothetical protein